MAVRAVGEAKVKMNFMGKREQRGSVADFYRFSLLLVFHHCHKRHGSRGGSNRRLSRYKFASAKAVNSRAVFFASPR